MRIDKAVHLAKKREEQQTLLLENEEELRQALHLLRDKLGISDYTDETIEGWVSHEKEHYKKGDELFSGDTDVTYAYAVKIERTSEGTVIQPTVNWNDGKEQRTKEREEWWLRQMVKVTAAPTNLSEDDISFLQEHSDLLDEDTKKRWGGLIEDENERKTDFRTTTNSFSSDILGEKPKSQWS